MVGFLCFLQRFVWVFVLFFLLIVDTIRLLGVVLLFLWCVCLGSGLYLNVCKTGDLGLNSLIF